MVSTKTIIGIAFAIVFVFALMGITGYLMSLGENEISGGYVIDEFGNKKPVEKMKEMIIQSVRYMDGTIPTEGKITYTIQELPELPDISIPNRAIKNAVNNWERLNPQIDFVETDSENSDFKITWQKIEKAEYAGIAHTGLADSDIIEIGLGSTDCNSNYIQYDENALTNTVMHEIGHLFGLGHIDDETHLMYGVDYVTTNFDNKGFRIPELLDGFYVGYLELEKETEQLRSQIDFRLEKYEEFEKEYKKLESEYQRTGSGVLYLELSQMVNDLNEYGEKTNELIYRYNAIVDEMNCYPNVLSYNPAEIQLKPAQ